MTLKCPPPKPRQHCDIEAEKAVLNCLIVAPGQLAIVQQEGLKPDDFYDDANREIYAAIVSLASDGVLADVTALLSRLKSRTVSQVSSLDFIGGSAYIFSILRMDALAHNSTHHAAAVVLQSDRREQERQAVDLLNKINSGQPVGDVESFIDGWATTNRERRKRKEGPKTMKQLIQSNREMRRPVIDDLLREGESMNVIAAPKTGKSWLVTGLALSVASGRWWLQTYRTTKGKVLIIDNELHPETSADRIPRVAEAMGIPMEEYENDLLVENMRGKLVDIFALEEYLRQFKPGELKMVILDALYRFLPPDTDENGNGPLAQVYNAIDRYADRLKAAFVLVHHTSKGNQSGKGITDVGAGAGTQSRAPDTHLILRQHEEKDAVVLDAVARSWKPIEPVCLRWQFPRWIPDSSLDPALLRSERPRRRVDVNKDAAPEPAWTVERFASQFVDEKPQQQAVIVARATEAGLSKRKANELIAAAEGEEVIYKWQLPNDRRRSVFATIKQPIETQTSLAN